jgi:hypothetical protein
MSCIYQYNASFMLYKLTIPNYRLDVAVAINGVVQCNRHFITLFV